MAARIWILNLHCIDNYEFHTHADVDNIVKAAFRKHCIGGRVTTIDYDDVDPEFLRRFPKYVPASAEVRDRGFKPVFARIIGHEVRDWLADVSVHSPRHHRAILNRRMSYAQMIDAADRWHEARRRAAEKLRDRAIQRDEVVAPSVLDLDGEFAGWRWVWLKSNSARDAEGIAMGNCVGSGAYDNLGEHAGIFSLRDPRGEPHVTVEIDGLEMQQAECRGGARVSARFRPLVDRMTAVIGVRLLINGDPTVEVEDGMHAVDGILVGDREIYHVADGVLHRIGGPARIDVSAGIYYERGVETRRMRIHWQTMPVGYYVCRMADDIDRLGRDDSYYAVGDRYRIETRGDIDGKPVERVQWISSRYELYTVGDMSVRAVASAVNIPEIRP